MTAQEMFAVAVETGNIQDWQAAIGQYADEKGWNETSRPPAEWAALAHTEISEAFESWRSGHPVIYKGEDGKPEGEAVEYADCLIRILHWMDTHKVDIQSLLAMKMSYNLQRPFRHGGKKA